MSRRSSILKLINKGDRVIEVGVWKGDFSREILRKDPSILHLVDPWIHQDNKGEWYRISQESMDSIYDSVVQKYGSLSNVKIWRVKSENFRPIPSVDLVYIDGDHSYEGVKKDLRVFWPMVKSGGYLTGDDYSWTNKECPMGPKPAIDEFVKNNNLQLTVRGDQWIIQKP